MERPPEQDQDPAASGPASAPASADASANAADPERGKPKAAEADLLSLALLVFFVALIGVVGALLLVPVLF